MLTDRVSLDVLHKLQDRFADLGRVTVCLCRVDGELITSPTWGSPFSALIGTSPRGQKAFARAVRACAKDVHAKVPLRCHEGMTLYSSPILVQGRRLGVIVVGTRSAIPPPPDKVRAIAVTYDIDVDQLLAGVGQIDPYNGGAPDAIHRFADVLADTIASLYGQAEAIDRQLSDLRAVHELSHMLAGTVDLQVILDTTARRVVEIMSVKASIIRLLDEDTDELVTKAVCHLSKAYLQKGPVMLRENAVDQAAFAGEVVYIEDMATDPRTRYPDEARRAGIVSGLCVPMTFRGQTVGVLRAYTGEKRVFTKSEAAMLRSIASQAAAAIINGRLHQEHLESERFQRQVKTAGQIQRRMMPETPPTVAGLAFGCVYDPSLEVGGDFYDFIETPNAGVGVCIADVVGKGIPAALMMASVRSALRAHATLTPEIESIMVQVNRHMYRDTLVSEFATMFYGVFSRNGKSFSYSNAGHPPPLWLRGARIRMLEAGGMVLGVDPSAAFDSETIDVQPGDAIVMVTDGVIEAMDFEGGLYGQDRLRKSVKKHHTLNAQMMAQQLLWDVRRFVGLADQSDDITIVVTKVVE